MSIIEFGPNLTAICTGLLSDRLGNYILHNPAMG